MPPQEEQIPEEGTPAPVTTPAEGEGENWKERYDHLQPEFTRVTQENAQLKSAQQELEALRNDPEAQQKFLDKLAADGLIEFEQPEEELTPDELEQVKKELADLKASFQESTSQAEAQRQEEAWQHHVVTVLGKIGEDRGTPLSEQEIEFVVGRALTMPPGDDKLPPLAAAYAELEKFREADQQTWRKTKQTTHRVSPNGKAGTEQPDLSTHEGRVEFALGRLEQ